VWWGIAIENNVVSEPDGDPCETPLLVSNNGRGISILGTYLPIFECIAPPSLHWSILIVKKKRINYGRQTTQAGRDCHEVTAS
jgi:hypothetical protein